MKLLFFVDDFKGGAGNVIQILSNSFSKRGYVVSVCCLGGTTPGRHSLDGVEVYRIAKNKNKIFTYISFISKSRAIIKKEAPDCVISFLFGVSAFVNLANRGTGIPLIVSERSDPNYLKPRGIVKYLTEYAYKKSNAIVVLFDAFKGLSGGKYVKKAFTIPNPVPDIELASKKVDKHEIRFVTIANNTPPKGLDILVDAFVKARKTTDSITLHIYGSDNNGDLKKRIESSDACSYIKQMGYTLNVNDALDWADVYVMPSRHEGFPNSLCEAMSAGKCCIATECHHGITEIIQNGVNGITVAAEDVSGLARAIVSITSNPELISKLGNEAKKVSQKYNTDSILDDWQSLIRRVMN